MGKGGGGTVTWGTGKILPNSPVKRELEYKVQIGQPGVKKGEDTRLKKEKRRGV